MVTNGSAQGNGNRAQGAQPRGVEETLSRLRDEGRTRAHRLQIEVDERREKLAASLDEAAVQLRARSESGGPLAQAAGQQSARNLRRSAAYLHSHQSQEIINDVEKSIRRFPIPWVATTFVMGYLFGRLFR